MTLPAPPSHLVFALDKCDFKVKVIWCKEEQMLVSADIWTTEPVGFGYVMDPEISYKVTTAGHLYVNSFWLYGQKCFWPFSDPQALVN